MPLSEHEQRVLEQMERALTSDDPRLASTLQSPGRRSGWRYVIAGVVVMVGLLLLVLGAALPLIWLGIIGFVLMFGGVVFGIQTPRRRGPVGVVSESGAVRQSTGKTKGKSAAAKRSFLSRLEDRWDRRRGQGG